MLTAGTAAAEEDEYWEARYYNNPTLSGTHDLKRLETEINYDWGEGSPSSQINDDFFSARWNRRVTFSAGTYRFSATMDDGMRVWVDGEVIIDSWYDSQEHTVTADIQLSEGDHDIQVKYYEAGGGAVARLSWSSLPSPAPPVIANWRGEYFNNMSLSGPPAIVRDDPEVNFDWGLGSPVPGTLQADHVSVRWTRNLFFNPGTYRFSVTSDDGFRLWVNNTLLIDQWHDQGATTYMADIVLPGGSIPIQMEYYENQFYAVALLSWAAVSGTLPPAPTQPIAPGTGSVTAYWLNVRWGPGVGYGIITTIPRGTMVTLTHRNPAATWVRAILPSGTVGWMNASYLSTTTPVSSLPIWPA